MSMELHTLTRQKLMPDPEFDEIAAIFITITNDAPETGKRPLKRQCKIGIYRLCY
jgi:hypothetical protein